jgi:hypothetical protein
MEKLKQTNLFGGLDEPKPGKRGNLGPFQQARLDYDYHRSESMDKRCATCRWFRIKKFNSGRQVFKCGIIGCSDSAASDIRAKHVCRHWEK